MSNEATHLANRLVNLHDRPPPAAEALAQQRRLYEAILNNTPDLAYVFDLTHRFIYANAGLLKMWGKTAEEALGKTCLELGYEPWHAEMHDREIESVIATKQSVRGEVPFHGTFGRRIYDYIFVPVLGPDGNVEAIAGTTRDVTDRKNAEDSVRRHAQEFESLINAAPLGAYLVDNDFRIAQVNPVARPVFGDIAGGVVGRDFGEVIRVLWDATFADNLIRTFRLTLETGTPFVSAETEQFRIDRGVVEYYEWRIDRVTFPDGRFGLVCYFRDISAQVLARRTLEEHQRELQQHREHLQHLVDQRTAELEASHQQLRIAERMASLGTLAAGLGHDVGNLLVPVRVRLENLHGMHLPAGAISELEGIQASASYLQKLSSGLKLLAADPTRRGKAESTELGAFWTEAEPVLRNALPRGITLVRDFPSCECWIGIGRAALTQAVFNLVQNAADAMKEQAQGAVTVWARCEPEHVVLGVTDTGPGMNEDVKHRCMEPFFTTKSRRISTGLGLALVYGIVRDAQGTIDIQSEPGKGATFTIRLASAPSPSTATPHPPRFALVSIKDARIQAYVTKALRDLNVEVTHRLNGRAPDLAVVDEGCEGVTAPVLRVTPHARFQELRASLREAVGKLHESQ